MKKKQSTVARPNVDLLDEGAIMVSCDIDNFDDIEPTNTLGDVGRYAKTFILPEEDFAYSNLLNAEKNGQASILSKQYCPCPKEGYVLVVCEYDVNF